MNEDWIWLACSDCLVPANVSRPPHTRSRPSQILGHPAAPRRSSPPSFHPAPPAGPVGARILCHLRAPRDPRPPRLRSPSFPSPSPGACTRRPSLLLWPLTGVLPFAAFQLLGPSRSHEHRLTCASDKKFAPLERSGAELPLRVRLDRSILAGVDLGLLDSRSPPLAAAVDLHRREEGFRNLGHDPGRFRRGFGGTVASGLGTDSQPCNLDAVKAEDEIEKIRHEFEEAKRSFLTIPVATKEMPKMNPRGIYVNKNLRLDTIQVYGFDYDYTLAQYTENLQSLVHDLAKKHLVIELKYPESCLQFEYGPTFPIRGLYYDRLKGCLLKLRLLWVHRDRRMLLWTSQGIYFGASYIRR